MKKGREEDGQDKIEKGKGWQRYGRNCVTYDEGKA